MTVEKTGLKQKAKALWQNNKLQAAAELYEQVSRLDDRDAEAWLMLGSIYARLGQYERSAKCSQRAIKIEPQNADAFSVMGKALQGMGRYNEAIVSYQQALRIKPDLADVHFNMGELHKDQGNFDAAEQCYQNAARYKPDHAAAHYHHASMLKIQGRAEEATASYDRALAIDPDLPEAYWNKLRVVPVIYDDLQQIDHYRGKYAEGLRKLGEHLSLGSSQDKKRALRGVGASTNFYLQYQGRDDRELQEQYGEMIHKIMAANYPQWAPKPSMPPPGPGGKIRIGYTTAFLRAHNGALWLLGWLRHRNRDRFEVICYHTGSKVDEKTREFMLHCDHFHHIPGDLEKTCAKIYSDKLHVLVYPELGMDAPSMLMAGLRLAPVQCVGWGHPITSGLPTMDYWLSCDLMEPEDAQSHYTEKLIRLANLGHCYSRDQHDRLQSRPAPKRRADFKLRDDAVLYLCGQSLFKYLPSYDHLFPEIAKRVPKAQFAFLAISSVYVVKRFMERVDRAFSAAGLKAQDCCVMLPRQSPEDYIALNQVVDVFLDNPPWSGNNTTLTAIDCHLPVVTWPTKFMRGRHSYGILKMLGLNETIARDGGEYIDIAARLGNDPAWRQMIVRKIARDGGRIYDDLSCVQTLEDFYVKAACS